MEITSSSSPTKTHKTLFLALQCWMKACTRTDKAFEAGVISRRPQTKIEPFLFAGRSSRLGLSGRPPHSIQTSSHREHPDRSTDGDKPEKKVKDSNHRHLILLTTWTPIVKLMIFLPTTHSRGERRTFTTSTTPATLCSHVTRSSLKSHTGWGGVFHGLGAGSFSFCLDVILPTLFVSGSGGFSTCANVCLFYFK